MSVADLKERLRQINVKDPNATIMIRDIIEELDNQSPTSLAVGTLTADDFTLTNTSWDDLTFPAAGLNPPGAASDPDRDTTFGYLLFAASGTEIITGAVQLPH